MKRVAKNALTVGGLHVQYHSPMLIVYTGNGKGKTTAALGLALRNLGHNNKVSSIHFMKNSESGEFNFKHPNFKAKKFGSGNFIEKNRAGEKDKKLAEKGFQIAKNKVKEDGLLILDELNMALYFNLLNKKEVFDFLSKIPKEKNVVVTGRKAPKKLIEMADIATEMKELKHYYQKDIKAKKGIEY